MRKTSNIFRDSQGFSLAEVIAALTIASLVLVAVLGIYSRTESSVAAITRRLDEARLPCEVLQRIAEDLDRIITSDSNTKITVANKLQSGFPAAKLTIVKTIYDSKNRPKLFEEIIWQASYDFESDTEGLVLYRSHNGLTSEDKLLDEFRSSLEKEYPFVPICKGVTFFKIQVPVGEELKEQWTSNSLPPAVVITISFAEPYETLTRDLEIPDEEKITRTIAVDRSRRIKFTVPEPVFDEDGDPNEVTEDGKGTEKVKEDQDSKDAKAIIDELMRDLTGADETKDLQQDSKSRPDSTIPEKRKR